MKELDKKLIINNGFWKVFQTFFQTKDGRNGDVITMEGVNSNKAIFVFSLTKNNEVIYINEYRFGPGKRMKMFPAGGLGKNKTTKEAAERELLEETGYKAEKLIFLGTYIHNGYMVGEIDLFFGVGCEEIIQQKLEDIEEIEVLKTSIANFENMINKNEINCPWTEIAFRRAKELTKNFSDFNI